MFVVVLFGQEAGLDFENAIEIESIASHHLVEVEAAALGAMDRGVSIDLANARLDGCKFVRRNQIRLVEQDNVGKSELLLGLRRAIDFTKEVLGVGHGHDGIELGTAANV